MEYHYIIIYEYESCQTIAVDRLSQLELSRNVVDKKKHFYIPLTGEAYEPKRQEYTENIHRNKKSDHLFFSHMTRSQTANVSNFREMLFFNWTAEMPSVFLRINKQLMHWCSPAQHKLHSSSQFNWMLVIHHKANVTTSSDLTDIQIINELSRLFNFKRVINFDKMFPMKSCWFIRL